MIIMVYRGNRVGWVREMEGSRGGVLEVLDAPRLSLSLSSSPPQKIRERTIGWSYS